VKYVTGVVSVLKVNAWVWYGVLSALYLILALVLPPNTATVQTYNLSNGAYHILMIMLGFPLIAVWAAAFYGYTKLAAYANAVASNGEGHAFRHLTRALAWLAWGLPISANLNAILGGISHQNHDFVAAGLILSHYFSLMIALFAFSAMADGARELADIVGKLPRKPVIRVALLGVIVMSAGFTYVTLHALNSHNNPYHLPVWLILFTIIIPYLYAWLMGLVAAFQIGAYRQSIPGLLYRRALSYVALGSALIISAAIVFQYITVSSGYLRRIHLNGSLLLYYFILLVYGVGFLLMARGAERLRKIEEI
jgi:hypothetical protein